MIVQARAGLDDKEMRSIAAGHGGSAERIGRSELFVVKLPTHASETAVQTLLARHPKLKFAELDRRVAPSMVTNDPYLGSQWHLSKINALPAWDRSSGQGVVIAILDSGILSTHPDFAGKLVPGWNFYDNNADLTDVTGHGTLVAGAAAATFNNGVGVAGVAGGARIMPLRIADTTGYAYYSTMARALTHAADNGARVANISYSGAYSSSTVQSAAQYLKSKGGLLVVSAGNAGVDDGAPATSTMIPVSATDGNDARTSWSSYGSYVAVAAPGAGIWTTNRSGSYSAASGTSLSAPVVAGTVALMMAAKPALNPAQVESLLFSTAADLGAAGRDIVYGHGRIDAGAAVAAAAGSTAADSTPPAASIVNPAGGSSVAGSVNVDVAASDNVGVTRVELRVNGKTVATDTGSPYQFSWDSKQLANGTATLTAVAFDAAGNSQASAGLTVSVANAVVADTTPPTVAFTSPGNGARISGQVTVSVAAADNAGAASVKQSLYINGRLVASAAGATLNYRWNANKIAAGNYVLEAVAVDGAGNRSAASMQVTR